MLAKQKRLGRLDGKFSSLYKCYQDAMDLEVPRFRYREMVCSINKKHPHIPDNEYSLY